MEPVSSREQMIEKFLHPPFSLRLFLPSLYVCDTLSQLQLVSTDENHLCTHCNQFYCQSCNPRGCCCLCDSLKPLSAITPQIKALIDIIPKHLSAKKYETSERGNRIVLLGKGLLFKSFYLVYDKRMDKIVELQEFGMFGKKK